MVGTHLRLGRRLVTLQAQKRIRKLKRFPKGSVFTGKFRKATAILLRTHGMGEKDIDVTLGVIGKSVSE